MPIYLECLRVDSVLDFDLYLNINNHFEGSAPLTIDKIRERLPGSGAPD